MVSGQIYLNCNLSGTHNQIQILQNGVHYVRPIIPLHSHSMFKVAIYLLISTWFSARLCS
jgi:hypothetical protein